MLTKVEVFSSNPSAPELPLGGFMPNDDPIQVRSIDGLGPVAAEIASTALASGRGELYQGSSLPKRNIVMNLGFNPDWANQTMSTLRQMLYRYLLPQMWTKLRFFSDYLPVVDIEGYVESFEPNIFSQDPEVAISILCHKPDFIESDATIYNGTVDDGTIEFEFNYEGTVPTGYELRIDRTVANPSYTGAISIVTNGQILEVDPVTIDTTKYFKMSSVEGAKRVSTIAVEDGAITNLLGNMSNLSEWPILNPGLNIVSVIAEEDAQAWSLAYFNRFGGL